MTSQIGASSGRKRVSAIKDFESLSHWRKECMGKVAKIPSGYTYLAQLVGHDMGHSAKLEQVVYTHQEGKSAFDELLRLSNVLDISIKSVTEKFSRDQKRHLRLIVDPESQEAKRYNLIANPLTLETVFGPGPDLMNHVFDQTTKKFHLGKVSRTSVFPDCDDIQVRCLYDKRNRDTLMLHELTVAWKHFHNNIMDVLHNEKGISWKVAYNVSRQHCVDVWHNIIRNDLMPRFVLKDIMNVEPHFLPKVPEVTLLFAVFRAFHCMPLDHYILGPAESDRLLQELMAKGFVESGAEKKWQVDWSFFFGANVGSGKPNSGPASGISPSVSRAFEFLGKMITQHDFSSAEDVNAPRLVSQSISEILQNWSTTIATAVEPIDARGLEELFNKAFGKVVGTELGGLDASPLYEALEVEALIQGKNGSFGPLGSVLLRGAIEQTIERVELPALKDENQKTINRKDFNLSSPATMLGLINSTTLKETK